MRYETTPPAITLEIRNLCKSICDGSPSYIPVIPAPGMEYQNCFCNVDKVVVAGGGHRINGWAIWQFANVLIEAEAHAVWQNDVMTLIDVTPHEHGEQQTLFLPDEGVKYQGTKIPSRRVALTDSSLVNEYITLANEAEKFIIERMTTTNIQPDDPCYPKLRHIWKRSRELNEIFKSNTGRNSLCPCGSGLKFKKCCGRFG